MAPHLIATPKAEETLFSLLIQIQKHLMFIFNFGVNFDGFSINFQTAQGSQMFQVSDFVTRMDILNGKLEVCLPLAYPSIIYKHISSLKLIYNFQLVKFDQNLIQ